MVFIGDCIEDFVCECVDWIVVCLGVYVLIWIVFEEVVCIVEVELECKISVCSWIGLVCCDFVWCLVVFFVCVCFGCVVMVMDLDWLLGWYMVLLELIDVVVWMDD